MILASSSLSRPGLTSTSTPRSLKMATAAGESLSEMRTREVMGLMTLGWRAALRPLGIDGSGSDSKRAAAVLPQARSGSIRRSRCLGQLALLDSEGVIEPVGQRLDIGGFDCRAAPDAQAGRRIAIRPDVECDLLLLEKGSQRLRKRGLAIGGKGGDRRIDDLQADAGI